MGALLSLPLMAIPSVGTLLTFGASCCGATACSALCSACGVFRSSIATRIAYAFLLLFNSILAWLMLTPWALKKLEGLTLDYMHFTCHGGECYGYAAVQRINFALGLFHFILAITLIGVHNSKDTRAKLQNGFWGPKIIVWLLLIVVTFLIPENFFKVWGQYFGFVGAMLFVLLGLILLVDLAHTYAEWCLEKIEDNDSAGWRVLLIGSTLGMYAASLAMVIVMYIFFAASGCGMNQAAITINLLVMLGVSAISIHPAVQESNPRAGLAQSAMVGVYCTYLTMSAVSMEPDDKNCNPLIRAQGTRTASVVIGAIVTMLTVAYTTTRAATQGFALGGTSSSGGYHRVGDEPEHGLVDQQPVNSRREMRAEALRRAIAEGSLPANALDDDDDDSDDGKPNDKDDERSGTQYNYTLFHVIFLLATCWVASLLVSTIEDASFDEGKKNDLAAVGRTYWASWVKIVSAWTCYAIYGWSLLAPVILPDRFGN